MVTPAGEGCQGKEASGEVGVLNVNLGSYSLNKTIDVEEYVQDLQYNELAGAHRQPQQLLMVANLFCPVSPLPPL